MKRHVGLVSSNPEKDWNYQKFILSNDPDYEAIIAPTSSNIYLPADFEQDLRKSYPEWWVKRYIDGDFSSFEGQIYPEFSRPDKHTLPKAVISAEEFVKLNPKWEKEFERVYAIDHGFINPTAIIELSIDRKRGIIYQTWEHYETQQTPNYHAKILLNRMSTVPYGKILGIVIDPSAKNSKQYQGNSETKNVVDLYNDEGVYPSLANNNVQAGILKVSQWIKLGHLYVLDTQVNTISEGENYSWKVPDINKSLNAEEKPVKHNDHAMDALRYAVMYLPERIEDLVLESYDHHSEYLGVRQFLESDNIPHALRTDNTKLATGWHDWY